MPLSSLKILSPWLVDLRSQLIGWPSARFYRGFGDLLLRPRRHLENYLIVEARASPRKDNAKVRNRRFQKKFNGTSSRPRLSVFCSSSQLYAMLIDDQNKKTLFYASTLQKSIRDNPDCSTINRKQPKGLVKSSSRPVKC
ncbi:ribosomal L18p/L5e family protein isoform X2 [Wolffia australiana]